MLLAVAITLALDLVTKAWAWEHLRNRVGIEIIPGFLHLEFAFNTGSAFGFLADQSWARGFFIAMTVFVVGYMVHLLVTLPAAGRPQILGIGMVVAGALGNLHDRLVRSQFIWGEGETRHGVVDFLVFFYWPGKRWPAFNVADVALLVGIGIFLLDLRRRARAAPDSTP